MWVLRKYSSHKSVVLYRFFIKPYGRELCALATRRYLKPLPELRVYIL
jgi:hypothetical protein